MRASFAQTPLRRRAAIAACLVVAMLAAPAAASAERRQADVVGVSSLSEQPTMLQQAPDIDAAAGILVTSDGRVLWSRNADQHRAMASTTKIMTALVVLDHTKGSEVVTVPKEAHKVAQNPVNLIPGERLTVQQLLETMLVASANDAAYTLAVHVGGSVPGFAAMMNAKAAQLGLHDTHYVNPHGLDVAGHYTSAADLVKLGRYAMQNPEFRRIVSLQNVAVTGPGAKTRIFETTDAMLKGYPGIEGIKTGMTNKAGYCFVSAARRGQVELYGVILGTPNEGARFEQSKLLLDWGFRHYRPIKVIDDGTRVGTVPVADWLDRDIVAKVGDATSPALFDLGGPVKRRYELSPSVGAPVRTGQVIGVVTALQGNSVLATEPIVSAEDMAAPNIFQRVSIWGVSAWRAVFGPKNVRTAVVTATN